MRYLALCLVLMACAATSGTEFPAMGGEGDACGASRYDFIVDQPRSVLTGVSFKSPLRVIEAGAAVTQDFVPERINIHLDELGIIRRLSCG